MIDNEVRIRAQTKSLERIEALLAQATNLREVVSIESQLTRRQADLDSLKSQQAYLADQTTLSTITVFIERTQEKKDDKDETGFMKGLSAGWGGFVAAMVGLATVLGFLLPFALVVALIGVPVWMGLKNVRRRRPGTGARAQLTLPLPVRDFRAHTVRSPRKDSSHGTDQQKQDRDRRRGHTGCAGRGCRRRHRVRDHRRPTRPSAAEVTSRFASPPVRSNFSTSAVETWENFTWLESALHRAPAGPAVW